MERPWEARLARWIFPVTGLAALYLALCALQGTTGFFLLVFAAVLALAAFVSRRVPLSPGRFALCLLLLSFLLKLAFVLLSKTRPVSDFEMLYNASVSLANGDTAVLRNSDYFLTWAYQTGFVLWQAFFIKFFGAGVTFFQVQNCLILAGTNVLLYWLARRCVSDRAARTVSLLYLLYPGVYYMAPVLTNQHLSNLLIYGALYLYAIKREKSLKSALPFAALAGLILALGNVIRPTAVVALAAVAVLELALTASRLFRRRPGAVRPAAPLLAFGVAYLLCTSLLSFGVEQSGLNPNGLKNTLPEWKFAEGLNYDTRGTYSAADETAVFASANTAMRAEAADSLIRERLGAGPGRLISLWLDKAKSLWTDGDDPNWAFDLSSQPTIGTKILGAVTPLSLLDGAARGFQAGIFCLFALACLRLSLRRGGGGGGGRTPFLPALLFLFYFGVQLFIEIQVRYRDFGMIAVFLMAAAALEWPRVRRPGLRDANPGL